MGRNEKKVKDLGKIRKGRKELKKKEKRRRNGKYNLVISLESKTVEIRDMINP